MELHKTEEHRDVAEMITNIAGLRSQLGKHSEALEMHEKALGNIFRKFNETFFKGILLNFPNKHLIKKIYFF